MSDQTTQPTVNLPHDFEALLEWAEQTRAAQGGAGYLTARRHYLIYATPERIIDLISRLKAALSDSEEYGRILDRSSELLTGVANAAKGEPLSGRTWSHHDLPEVVASLVAAAQANGVQIPPLVSPHTSRLSAASLLRGILAEDEPLTHHRALVLLRMRLNELDAIDAIPTEIQGDLEFLLSQAIDLPVTVTGGDYHEGLEEGIAIGRRQALAGSLS